MQDRNRGSELLNDFLMISSADIMEQSTLCTPSAFPPNAMVNIYVPLTDTII